MQQQQNTNNNNEPTSESRGGGGIRRNSLLTPTMPLGPNNRPRTQSTISAEANLSRSFGTNSGVVLSAPPPKRQPFELRSTVREQTPPNNNNSRGLSLGTTTPSKRSNTTTTTRNNNNNNNNEPTSPNRHNQPDYHYHNNNNNNDADAEGDGAFDPNRDPYDEEEDHGRNINVLGMMMEGDANENGDKNNSSSRKNEKHNAHRIATLRQHLIVGRRFVMNIHETSCFLFEYRRGSGLEEFNWKNIRRHFFDAFDHWVFDLCLSVLIFYNLGYFIIDSPFGRTLPGAPQVIEYSEYVIQGLFTIEIFMKIVSLGFAFHPYAYCRDPLRLLELVVVICGFIAIPFYDTPWRVLRNLKLIRLFRLLERIMQYVPELRGMFDALVGGLSRFADIVLFVSFLVVALSIVGVQLFRGEFHNRCYFVPPTSNPNISSSSSTNPLSNSFASYNSSFLYNNLNYTDRVSVFYGESPVLITSGIFNQSFNKGSASLVVTTYDPSTPILDPLDFWPCAKNGNNGLSPCGRGATCLSNTSIFRVPFANFDHLGNAIFAVLKLTSVDGIQQDIRRMSYTMGSVSAIYGIIIVFLISFCAMNFFIALLSWEYDIACLRHLPKSEQHSLEDLLLAEDVEEEEEQEIKEIVVAKTDDNNQEQQKPENEKKLGGDVDDDDEKKKNEVKPALKSPRQKSPKLVAPWADPEPLSDDFFLIESPFLSTIRLTMYKKFVGPETSILFWISVFVTTFNVVILAIFHDGMSTELENVFNWINVACGIYYLVEMVIKLFTLSFQNYFSTKENWFEFLLACCVIAELATLGGNASLSVFSALRAVRMLKIFSLATKFERPRQISITVLSAAKASFMLFLVLIFYVTFCALFAVYLFEGAVPTTTRPNFSDLPQSILALFIVLSGESWVDIVKNAMLGSGGAASIFFFIFFFFGTYLLLNLFVVIVIASYKHTAEQIAAWKLREKKMRQRRNEKIFGTAAGSTKSPSPSSTMKNSPIQENILRVIDQNNNNNNNNDADDADADDLGVPQRRPPAIPRLDMAALAEQQQRNSEPPSALETNRDEKKSPSPDKDGNGVTSTTAVPPRQQRQNSPDNETTTAASSPRNLSRTVREKQQKTVSMRLATWMGMEYTSPEQIRASLYGNSCNLFERDNSFRFGCAVLVSHPFFEFVTTLVILESLIFLGFETKKSIEDIEYLLSGNLASDPLRINNIFITCWFTLEMLLKMIAFGIWKVEDQEEFYGGTSSPVSVSAKQSPKQIALPTSARNNIRVPTTTTTATASPSSSYHVPYLWESWNQFDFIVVIITILSNVIPMSFLKALRIFRFAAKWHNQKVVLSAMLRAIPEFLNVVGLVLAFVFFVSVLGVQLFQGSFSSCNDPSILYRSDCVGNFTTSRIWYEQQSQSPYDATLFNNGTSNNNNNNFSSMIGETTTVLHNSTAFVSRRWVTPFYNFDNAANGLVASLTLFWNDGWPAVMFNAIDSSSDKNVGLLPTSWSTVPVIFFVGFMMIGNFFLHNLFIGTLLDLFKREHKFEVGLSDREGNQLLSAEQEQWVRNFRFAQATSLPDPPPPPQNRFRKFCCYLYFKDENTREEVSKMFEYTVSAAVFLNVGFMATEYEGMPEFWESFLFYQNLLLTIFFALEVIVTFTAVLPHAFFDDSNHIFNALVTAASFVSVRFSGPGINVLRVVRIFRILQVIKQARGVYRLFQALVYSLPQIANVSILLVLIFYIFGLTATQLFGNAYIDTTDPNEILGPHYNFQHAGYSILTLVQIATTDNWAAVMEKLANMNPLNSGCSYDSNSNSDANLACGNWYAIPFFILFLLVAYSIGINLYIFVIVDNVLELNELNDVRTQWMLTQLADFRKLWMQFDKRRSKQLKWQYLVLILRHMLVMEKNTLKNFRREVGVPIRVFRSTGEDILVVQSLIDQRSADKHSAHGLEVQIRAHYKRLRRRERRQRLEKLRQEFVEREMEKQRNAVEAAAQAVLSKSSASGKKQDQMMLFGLSSNSIIITANATGSPKQHGRIAPVANSPNTNSYYSNQRHSIINPFEIVLPEELELTSSSSDSDFYASDMINNNNNNNNSEGDDDNSSSNNSENDMHEQIRRVKRRRMLQEQGKLQQVKVKRHHSNLAGLKVVNAGGGGEPIDPEELLERKKSFSVFHATDVDHQADLDRRMHVKTLALSVIATNTTGDVNANNNKNNNNNNKNNNKLNAADIDDDTWCVSEKFLLKRLESLAIPVMKGGLVDYSDCIFGLTRSHAGSTGELSGYAKEFLSRVRNVDYSQTFQVHHAVAAMKIWRWWKKIQRELENEMEEAAMDFMLRVAMGHQKQKDTTMIMANSLNRSGGNESSSNVLDQSGQSFAEFLNGGGGSGENLSARDVAAATALEALQRAGKLEDLKRAVARKMERDRDRPNNNKSSQHSSGSSPSRQSSSRQPTPSRRKKSRFLVPQFNQSTSGDEGGSTNKNRSFDLFDVGDDDGQLPFRERRRSVTMLGNADDDDGAMFLSPHQNQPNAVRSNGGRGGRGAAGGVSVLHRRSHSQPADVSEASCSTDPLPHDLAAALTRHLQKEIAKTKAENDEKIRLEEERIAKEIRKRMKEEEKAKREVEIRSGKRPWGHKPGTGAVTKSLRLKQAQHPGNSKRMKGRSVTPTGSLHDDDDSTTTSVDHEDSITGFDSEHSKQQKRESKTPIEVYGKAKIVPDSSTSTSQKQEQQQQQQHQQAKPPSPHNGVSPHTTRRNSPDPQNPINNNKNNRRHVGAGVGKFDYFDQNNERNSKTGINRNLNEIIEKGRGDKSAVVGAPAGSFSYYKTNPSATVVVTREPTTATTKPAYTGNKNLGKIQTLLEEEKRREDERRAKEQKERHEAFQKKRKEREEKQQQQRQQLPDDNLDEKKKKKNNNTTPIDIIPSTGDDDDDDTLFDDLTTMEDDDTKKKKNKKQVLLESVTTTEADSDSEIISNSALRLRNLLPPQQQQNRLSQQNHHNHHHHHPSTRKPIIHNKIAKICKKFDPEINRSEYQQLFSFIPHDAPLLAVALGQLVSVHDTIVSGTPVLFGWALCSRIANPSMRGYVPVDCICDAVTGASVVTSEMMPMNSALQQPQQVQVQVQQSQQETSLVQSPRPRDPVKTELVIPPVPLQQINRQAPPPPVHKLLRAFVQFDFVSQDPVELSVRAGELVEIECEEEDGWTRVRRMRIAGTAQCGLVPATYLKLLDTASSSSSSFVPFQQQQQQQTVTATTFVARTPSQQKEMFFSPPTVNQHQDSTQISADNDDEQQEYYYYNEPEPDNHHEVEAILNSKSLLENELSEQLERINRVDQVKQIREKQETSQMSLKERLDALKHRLAQTREPFQ